MIIKFEIPIRTVSEANRREHWGTKARRVRLQRDSARVMTLVHLRGRPLPLHVTLTRVAPRALDDDNLARSFKAIRDGIADALRLDDRDRRLTWAYAQRRGKPREHSVEVRMEQKES